MKKSHIFAIFFLEVSVITLGLLRPNVALSQNDANRTEPKTVSWYADHQQARAKVQLACIDDPGHLANDPDCINAEQASVEVALRKARSFQPNYTPDNPAFWSAAPKSRTAKLIMCRDSPNLDGCVAAKESLIFESGSEK